MHNGRIKQGYAYASTFPESLTFTGSMARRSKKNFYGVRVGRDGPKVYCDWTQCQAAVSGFSNSLYEGFATLHEAEAWVDTWISAHMLSQTPSSPDHLASLSCNPSKSGQLPIQSLPQLQPQPQPHELLSEYLAQPINDLSVPSERVEITDGLPVRPILSAQQRHVLDRVERGENVFFTGSAGTGKSVLLRAIIDTLKDPSSLAVTASTGIAAVNIGGTTLHSFAGIGLGKEHVDCLVKKIRASKYYKERWRRTKTLIIDEVSMIDGTLFDKLELIARKVRNEDVPFGGIQLVLSGDFCQLPPVPDQLDGIQLPITFAFEADSWKKCIGTPIVLYKVFRQRDQAFVRMLNSMRYGAIEKADEERFQALSRPLVYDDGIDPTELFPLRQDVERANATRLANLSDPSHTYVSLDIPGKDVRGNTVTPKQAEKLLERLVAAQRVTLKIGAQVMLIKNLVQGHLVNGSQGKVVAFKTVAEAQFDRNEIALADNSQDNKRNDRKGSSEVNPEAMDKISGGTRVWPFVRFTNGRKILCVPVEFDVVNAWGLSEAKRDQIPLILAWALSVHKSQGQTLNRVKVNLARTFEKGQAYVALSRATRMETLQVLHFDRSKVMAHPRVLEWHANLMREIQKEEEMAIMQEMDSEEALKAFFEDDTLI